ncbi:hypothetical protein BCO18175_05722 [Burkholderia contaminans]|uniref:hypothetical protein n=1 Tax=Burkholderia contaminans TaxID=488447 RepID=UPI0014530189|nr:hypothetical protein [Burkholderia contaminans]VWD24643.1 hypothetical protein BCO18175_05722 [Burkholderia contaminans]
MTSISLLANNYVRLRQRLSQHLDSTIPEVNVPLPLGISDELSFYRLVIWGFIVVQESAKIHIKFLRELPPALDANPVLPELATLRTWIGHNLDFNKARDAAKMRSAQQWFRQHCGVGTPTNEQHWEACCSAIARHLTQVLDEAIAACDLLDTETDGKRLVSLLNERISRTWEAYRFDSYVSSAAERLGYRGIDVVELRKKRLDAWRKVLSVSEPASWDRLINQCIEKDLLDLMFSALPVTSLEVMDKLQLAQVSELAAAMLILRGLGNDSHVSASAVIEALWRTEGWRAPS